MADRNPADNNNVEIRTYRIRWLILLVVALLNLSNAMSWIALSPVANYADAFYNHQDSATIFALVFMFVSIPFGFLAMYAERKGGLRPAILVAAWCNGIGGVVRYGSSYVPPGKARFYTGVAGQCLCGVAFAFIMFLPSKVAAAWFPDSQRAIATTIALLSNPVGVLIVNLVVPYIVSSEQNLHYVNLMTGVVGVIVTIFAVAFITRSKPRMPPSVSAGQESHGFFKGLWKCLCSSQYLVLLIAVSGGVGLSNTLFALMQQLLCPSGYSNHFSGVAAALIIVGGITGGILSGLFVDYTKLYVQTMKTCMLLAVVFGLTFLQLAIRRCPQWLLLGLAFLFGSFGVAAYPVGLELAAECTFPVTETTSVGLIVIAGQLQGVLFTMIMRYFAIDITGKIQDEKCSEGREGVIVNDWTISTYVVSGIALFLLLVLFAFFYPKLKRVNAGSSNVQMRKADNKVTIPSARQVTV